MHSDTSYWSRLQERLRAILEPEEFATWFVPLVVQSENEAGLVLGAPNERFVHTLEESYRDTLDREAGLLFDEFFSVTVIARGRARRRGFVGGSGRARRAGGRAILAGAFRSDRRSPESQVPLRHLRRRQLEPVRPRRRARRRRESRRTATTRSSSTAASGSARPTCCTPSATRSSHRRPELKVLYFTAEQFVNQLINSLRFKSMHSFRERYRSIDVLLVDDIQFLANKERTQEEFFHTFNTLYTSQRQIILSSDSSPRNIPAIEERLRSRFEWGLIADIQAPDLETKVAILRRKADQDGVVLPDDVALFIAYQVKSNVRELEGMLNRVVAFSSLTAKPLSLELAKETLKDILPEEGRRATAADIIKFVARHYGLKVSEIKSKSNSKQIAFPRQVAMFLCKELTELSYPEIGRQFNDKHHSTVMYSVDKILKLRATDAELERTLDGMTRHLGLRSARRKRCGNPAETLFKSVRVLLFPPRFVSLSTGGLPQARAAGSFARRLPRGFPQIRRHLCTTTAMLCFHLF